MQYLIVHTIFFKSVVYKSYFSLLSVLFVECELSVVQKSWFGDVLIADGVVPLFIIV